MKVNLRTGSRLALVLLAFARWWLPETSIRTKPWRCASKG